MFEHPAIYSSNEWKMGDGTPFSSRNPASGDVLWSGKSSAKKQIDEVVFSAEEAFKSWSQLPINERYNHLSRFSDCLKESQYSLAEVFSKETGKPLWESLKEVEAIIDLVPFSLESYGKRCAGMVKDDAKGQYVNRHRPHGILSVMGCYTFSAQFSHAHIIPALLSGNTVLFKPSEKTPLSAEKITECWKQADLPPSVFNLVQGGEATEEHIYMHPSIQGLFFNGSYSKALSISRYFGSTPSKILTIETGGNNALIIDEIDDFQAAVYHTVQSAFLSSGQKNTCAKRLIVCENEKLEEFISLLVSVIQSISIGPYTEIPEPFMGPVISEAQANHLLLLQEQCMKMGGNAYVSMKHIKKNTGFLSPGLIDMSGVKEKKEEEMLGPFLQLIRVKDLDEAIQEANSTRFGLSAGIFTKTKERYYYFLRRIRAGLVNWNVSLNQTAPNLPFGGIQESGNHRPSGFYAADYCSYPVSSVEKKQLEIPSVITPGISIGYKPNV